jgi:hypothetical protein
MYRSFAKPLVVVRSPFEKLIPEARLLIQQIDSLGLHSSEDEEGDERDYKNHSEYLLDTGIHGNTQLLTIHFKF